MTTADMIAYRLRNQRLNGTNVRQPTDVVTGLGATQAQEYAMAKWAIGVRSAGLTDADVEAAFTDGTILRTHLLRPTWHFVAPADIRWMLALTAPRVHAVNAYSYRKFELDRAVLKRSNDTLVEQLGGGKHLTRPQLKAALEQVGIVADGLRLGYVLMQTELDGLVCSGPRYGKQFTYALLDERVPPTRPLDRDEALAELTRRYFISRGPATLQDYVWWSGLTMKDVKRGVAMLGPNFVQETIDGQLYVFRPIEAVTESRNEPMAWLLPDYDEYGIAYRDRTAFFNALSVLPDSRSASMAFDRLLIVDGVVAGSWRRTLTNTAVDVRITSFRPFKQAEQWAVEKAVQQYAQFLNVKYAVSMEP